MTQPLIGTSVRRREDARLLTGRGRFFDDLALPGLLAAAFLRSPHAHARIVSIDCSALSDLSVEAAGNGGFSVSLGGAGAESSAKSEASAFPPGATMCHKCNTSAVIIMDGCATCLNCGYSKCG